MNAWRWLSGIFFSFLPNTFCLCFSLSCRRKKPDSFKSGFLVFEVGALLRSDNAVECRGAHSGKKSHSKWDTIIVSERPCAGLAFELFCLMYRNTNAVEYRMYESGHY